MERGETVNCPICDREMEVKREIVGHIVHEVNAKCEDERHYYSYSFYCGHKKEDIGRVVFYNNSADSEEQSVYMNKYREFVLNSEKERYLQAIKKD